MERATTTRDERGIRSQRDPSAAIPLDGTRTTRRVSRRVFHCLRGTPIRRARAGNRGRGGGTGRNQCLTSPTSRPSIEVFRRSLCSGELRCGRGDGGRLRSGGTADLGEDRPLMGELEASDLQRSLREARGGSIRSYRARRDPAPRRAWTCDGHMSSLRGSERRGLRRVRGIPDPTRRRGTRAR